MTALESTKSFWERFGISEEDRLSCLDVIQRRYEGGIVQKLQDQGYCSLTLLVTNSGQSLIVQIRPAQHALDMGIVQAAKEIYEQLAPSICHLHLDLDFDINLRRRRLCVYEMERMDGTPLARVLPRCPDSILVLWRKQERLVESFTAMIAQSLKGTQAKLEDRSVRADSHMEDTSSILSRCTGKVGSSIMSRLEELRGNLPEGHLRTIADETLASIKALKDYPVVLNHGDLIPSNILVDEETWEITGLVDWAEAEYLPFGTCLYGLEHLLGYVSTSHDTSLPQTNGNPSCREDGPVFIYYEYASELRKLFWQRLFDLAPWLKSREAEVRLMRKLGILLWYGLAWDDGVVDRVVDDVDDPVEMACLRTFLEVD